MGYYCLSFALLVLDCHRSWEFNFFALPAAGLPGCHENVPGLSCALKVPAARDRSTRTVVALTLPDYRVSANLLVDSA